jgi:hypothetical protein
MKEIYLKMHLLFPRKNFSSKQEKFMIEGVISVNDLTLMPVISFRAQDVRPNSETP